MHVPDVLKYYYASHLRSVASWSCQAAPNRWSVIGMGSLYPAPPCSLIWSPSLHLDSKLQDLCLAPMLFTLKIWHFCFIKFSLSSPCPPLSIYPMYFSTPLFLMACLTHVWFHGLILHCFSFIILSTQLHADSLILRTSELNTISQNMLFSYLQIHYLSMHSPSLTLPNPTTFEYICAQGPHQLHLIS